ncbi:hypothetical protein ACTHT8_12950, partial [Neisseria sp. P0021.S004]
WWCWVCVGGGCLCGCFFFLFFCVLLLLVVCLGVVFLVLFFCLVLLFLGWVCFLGCFWFGCLFWCGGCGGGCLCCVGWVVIGVVGIGIGGFGLGSLVMCAVLGPFGCLCLGVRFVSSVGGSRLCDVLFGVYSGAALFIVVSKTFIT